MDDPRVDELENLLCEERAARLRAESDLREMTEAAELLSVDGRGSDDFLNGYFGSFPGMICRRVAHADGSVSFPFITGNVREVLGISPEQLRSNPTFLLDCIHPEDRDRYDREYAQSRENLTDVKMDVRLSVAEAATIWIRIRARPEVLSNGDVRWNVVTTNISATKDVEAQLRESEAQYRAVFEKLPTPLYVHRDGIVVYANHAAAEVFAADRATDLVGRPTLDFYAPDTHDQIIARRQECYSPDAENQPILSWLQRLDGSPFFGETVGTKVLWAGEECVLVMVHDITAHKNAEEMSEAGRRAAEEANHAKSHFLASMSHELRTPLNGVLGAANLLLADGLEPIQRERVEIIQRSGDALLALLNDILDISKVEAGRLELEDADFRLDDLLASVADLWAPQTTQKGLSFVYDRAALAFPVLRSDPARIRQILFNLVSNALKFTEAGSIELRVGQSVKSAGFVETRIEVVDSGPGIPSDQLERIFEKFVQADGTAARRHGGSGLGLSLCKSFAAALNGSVTVESTPGEGSTFRFGMVCPVGEPERIAPAAGESAAASGGDRRLRILVAEDNAINQKVIVAILEIAGHCVDVAGNGTEAVRAVTDNGYDVVLMDIQMPEMDGIAATRRIRSLHDPVSKLPIIAVTANAMSGDREEYIDAGMNDYVSKPIEPVKLAEALRRQCGDDIATGFRPVATAAREPASAGTMALTDELDDLLQSM